MLKLSRSTSCSNTNSDPKSNTALTGYFVGCFGSPQWETRIMAQADKAARKATPSVSNGGFSRDHFSPSEIRSALASGSIQPSSYNPSVQTHTHSTTNSNSLGASSRRHTGSSSRVPSVSFLEMTTPNMGITSCGKVHPGSPACNDQLFGSNTPKYQTPKQSKRSSRGSKKSRRSSTSPWPTLVKCVVPLPHNRSVSRPPR